MSAYVAASPSEPQPEREPQPQGSAPSLFAQLLATHAVLRERIAELGAITGQAEATRLECTSARLRLSQASIERRSVLNRILESLGGTSDAAGLEILARVRAADGELIAHSVKHLGIWTADAVAADWRGYCEASQSMREHMLSTVTAEAELLRGLLSR